MSQEKTAIFLHIPKTAGTTMREILRRNYRRGELLGVRIRHRSLYFARLAWRSRLRRPRCVMGHFGYGIHRYLHGDYEYFTMLRDPVQRVVSIYFFALRKKDHHLRRLIISQNMSLEDFVNSKASNIYNHQTRMLAALDGRFRSDYIKDEIGEAELARARANLASGIRVIGLTERFDESLILFRKAFGWNEIRYVPLNVTAKKDREVPARVIERIRENNQYDLRLYDYAKELMEQQIKAYDGDFIRDLREFRELNAASSRNIILPSPR